MNIEIRECTTFEELSDCVQLQRDVFGLPEIEISPVRHLIVTKNAGGFSLGAFVDEKLIGFVLSVPAFLHGEKAYYSHMTAVLKEFQSYGIGAKLKWAQREKSVELGVKFIKWTYQPVLARNAFFNLEKLGVIIKHYEPNFYGTDYPTADKNLGLDSDRLFAEWHLESDKVNALAKGEKYVETAEAKVEIEIPNDWNELVKNDLVQAIAEQKRIKDGFQKALAEGLICKGFLRDERHPKYLFY
ncbi:MAG: GNAT family N-acetyltransferase [Acidobacteriota bacterium]|mgnify:CR=1 FL=1